MNRVHNFVSSFQKQQLIIQHEKISSRDRFEYDVKSCDLENPQNDSATTFLSDFMVTAARAAGTNGKQIGYVG